MLTLAAAALRHQEVVWHLVVVLAIDRLIVRNGRVATHHEIFLQFLNLLAEPFSQLKKRFLLGN